MTSPLGAESPRGLSGGQRFTCVVTTRCSEIELIRVAPPDEGSGSLCLVSSGLQITYLFPLPSLLCFLLP